MEGFKAHRIQQRELVLAYRMEQVNSICPGDKLDVAYNVSVKELFAQTILHVVVLGHLELRQSTRCSFLSSDANQAQRKGASGLNEYPTGPKEATSRAQKRTPAGLEFGLE